MNKVASMDRGVAFWVKFLVAFVVCIAIRLVPPPFRAPNVEPVLATMMPFAKSGGALIGFLFAALSMVAFDIISGHLGQWTLITALTYGFVGALAPTFLSKLSGVRGYVSYAVVGTLIFDGITGVIAGPLLFGQPLAQAFFGQIPFTMMHLVGNMAFALTLSPIVEIWVVKNEALETFFSKNTLAVRN